MTNIYQLPITIYQFVLNNLFWFKSASLLLSAIFLFVVVYFNIKLNLMGEKVDHWMATVGQSKISKRRSLKAWKQIKKRLTLGTQNNLKLALLEADKILDEILKMSGYQGKNIDERLENIAPEQISNIEELKQVHQLRHRIAREPDFQLEQNEAEAAIDIYKKTFIDLNLIGED